METTRDSRTTTRTAALDARYAWTTQDDARADGSWRLGPNYQASVELRCRCGNEWTWFPATETFDMTCGDCEFSS